MSTASPNQTKVSSAPSNFSPITGSSNVVIGGLDILFMQNLSTSPLYVMRGTGAAGNRFSYILAAGVAQDDGLGGSLSIDDFVGTVSLSGVSSRYNLWKR